MALELREGTHTAVLAVVEAVVDVEAARGEAPKNQCEVFDLLLSARIRPFSIKPSWRRLFRKDMR